MFRSHFRRWLSQGYGNIPISPLSSPMPESPSMPGKLWRRLQSVKKSFLKLPWSQAGGIERFIKTLGAHKDPFM
jgi:hypothetical protein